VKVDRRGGLILSARGTQAANLITIVGTSELSPDPLEQIGTAVKEIPVDFTIAQSYPNPANTQTIIRYGLPKKSRVTVTVYSMLGEQITGLVDDVKPEGYYQAVFGRAGVASGVYFYTITAVDFLAGSGQNFTRT
jgi:hypothetical protein